MIMEALLLYKPQVEAVRSKTQDSALKPYMTQNDAQQRGIFIVVQFIISV